MIDQIAQVGVFTTGIVAVFLAGSTDAKHRMWAGLAGLSSEPFWFATAIINQQWGITCLATVYAFSWWRVFTNNRELVRNKQN